MPEPGNLPPKAARMRALADGETEARASEIANPGRPVKRAPISVRRLGPVSEHGHVVELEIEEPEATRRYAFKPPMPLLLWSEPRKALLWFEGAKVPKRERTDNPPATAAKAWERFHGWEADTVRTIKAGEPSSWRRVGRAVSITYRNPDRWGPDDAEHKIRTDVNVYRGGSVWVLRGGRLRMTAHGIEG